MSRKHVSQSKRSRSKARQARREAREVREMLTMPVSTQRGASRRTAKSRRRLLKVTLGLVVLVSMVASLWVLVHKAFYNNPEFTLEQFEVKFDGYLTKQEILDTAGVSLGGNLLKLDLATIDSRLRQRSQVKDVRVTRQIPDTLAIEVFEREPIAWIGYRGRGQDIREKGVLVDAEGVAIYCHNLFKDFFELPVILVSEDRFANEISFGDRINLPPVHAALNLIQRWPSEKPDPRMRIVQILAHRSYRLDIDFNNTLRVLFNPDGFSGQILKLRDTLTHGDRKNRHFKQIDLTVKDNIPVIYHDESFEPPFPNSPQAHAEISLPAPPVSAPPTRSVPKNHLSDDDLKAILRMDS